MPGQHVIGSLPRRGKIERQQGLDQGGTALQKNDGVLRRNRHQLTQVTLGLGSQVDERLAAMTEFHHRGALAVPLQQLVLSLTQYRLAQSRRTRAAERRVGKESGRTGKI